MCVTLFSVLFKPLRRYRLQRGYRVNQSLLYIALPAQQQKGGKLSTKAPTTPILGKQEGRGLK